LYALSFNTKFIFIFDITKGGQMKPGHNSNKGPFRTHTTVSPEQIMTAGGTTAFGLKAGKNNESIVKALENSAKPEPFTDEEWNDLLTQMANDK
jgi:hypothetical protein